MSQDSINPFAVSDAAGDRFEMAQTGLQPCYSDRRLLNLFIDYAFNLLFSILIVSVIGIIGGEQAIEALDAIPELMLGALLMSAYYIGFESTTGRTPAKFITGTKVVTLDGKKPGFGQIVIRTLCRFIPFEPFSCLGKYPRGWHDRFSKTMVVRVRDLYQ